MLTRTIVGAPAASDIHSQTTWVSQHSLLVRPLQGTPIKTQPFFSPSPSYLLRIHPLNTHWLHSLLNSFTLTSLNLVQLEEFLQSLNLKFSVSFYGRATNHHS
jgi:hypothetical protein